MKNFLSGFCCAWLVGLMLYVIFYGILGHATEHSPKYRIGIIDTGYDPKSQVGPKLKLCKTGHYDYNMKSSRIGNMHPHGTLVAQVIAKELEDVDYCAVIFQIESNSDYTYNAPAAVKRAVDEKLTAVNISVVGKYYSFEERDQFKRGAQAGIQFFVAAGNDNMDLDKTCIVYPGCYRLPNMHIVGALSRDFTQKTQYSNYGEVVDAWFPGDVKDKNGQWAQGTSFASPAALADYILSLEKQ